MEIVILLVCILPYVLVLRCLWHLGSLLKRLVYEHRNSACDYFPEDAN